MIPSPIAENKDSAIPKTRLKNFSISFSLINKLIDSVQLILKILNSVIYTLENLLAADKIPFADKPKIKETITLSETLKTHHDSSLGINGNEYFHNFFTYLILNKEKCKCFKIYIALSLISKI